MKKGDKKLLVKYLIALAIILSLLIIVSLNRQSSDEMIIGGDRDEHGCLGPAGYSWNSTEQECVKEWESGEERYQVTSFNFCIQAGYPALESYPRQCNTPGGRHFVEELE